MRGHFYPIYTKNRANHCDLQRIPKVRPSGRLYSMAAILIAGINLILPVIYSIAGKRNAMFTALIFAGVLFTIGFSVCSNSRMDFR